jgi:hypothetical protein
MQFADDAVVSNAVRPKATEFPAEGLAKTAGVVKWGNALVHVIEDSAGSLFV